MVEILETIKASISSGLRGEVRVPGDKSISHRALILGSLTIGETTVDGLLDSEDVLSTANAISALGAKVYIKKPGICTIKGVGVGGFKEPDNIIDCGNSGTSARLLLGAVSTNPIKVTFTGDGSLRERPMDRVVVPLTKFGATFSCNLGNKLPINVVGSDQSIPIRYELPVPSAQVKSAILLAGLNTRGRTTVVEREATRDHTEKMLKAFGVNVIIDKREQFSEISVDGFPRLKPVKINVPGDISSASFPIAAACMVPGSEIFIRRVGINPLRDGFIDTLVEMGAKIKVMNRQHNAGELVADIKVTYSPHLKGLEVPAHRAARMIDEYPILSMVAATANGPTIMKGIRELRYKESDRIESIEKGLQDSGIDVIAGEDTLVVNGSGRESIKGGCQINAYNDHRIAMSFTCLGLASEKAIQINGANSIHTSFPNFVDLMHSIGACITISKNKA